MLFRATIDSTGQMGEKLDRVSDTINGNVGMLEELVCNVSDIKNSMQEVKKSTDDISFAMDKSGASSQLLSEMSQKVYQDALQSVEYSKKVSGIDDTLSQVVSKLYNTVNEGEYSVTNEEFIEVLHKARISHIEWLAKIEKMMQGMLLLPLQTNSMKCAFGHFFYAMNVKHEGVLKEWEEIEIQIGRASCRERVSPLV